MGIHITHNLIHDTPQSGIFVWGSGHTIEYNHIRHTCTESEDTGAIGGGAIDWLSWLGTVYHAGQPLRTGVTVAKTETGPNLIANAGLEGGEIGQAPKGWNVADFQDDGTRVRVVNDQAHEGACSALIEPARSQEEGKRAETVCLTMGSLPFQPGKPYRLSIWMKSEGELTPAWRPYELVFRLPKDGDQEYKSTMDTLMWRITFPKGSGSFRLDEASLREAELADEWEGWQAQGLDKHSIVADPLFVDPEHDNFQLKPHSPALKLGFEAIPFERIGPYQDGLRASWPIVEMPGAREVQTGG